MYQNPYFLEKSMEQNSQSIERESRNWWKFGNSSGKEPAIPAPESNSVPSTCCGKNQGVCCEAYTPCQA